MSAYLKIARESWAAHKPEEIPFLLMRHLEDQEEQIKKMSEMIDFMLGSMEMHDSAVHQLHLAPKDRLPHNRLVGREKWPEEDR